MRPRVRDTLSLKPQGFLGCAFLASRLIQLPSLAIIVALLANLLYLITAATKDNNDGKAPVNLIVVTVFTGAAVLWTLLSLTGYSRRYLPYGATWSIDVLFLLPFAALSIVLGLPLRKTNCNSVSPPNGRFEIAAPPGGRIAFPSDGQGACARLFVVWGLLMVVGGLFVVTALSVGCLHLGERQLRKAIFAVRREEEEEGPGPGPSAGPEMRQPSVPSIAPSRPSVGENRFNVGRPLVLPTTGLGASGREDAHADVATALAGSDWDPTDNAAISLPRSSTSAAWASNTASTPRSLLPPPLPALAKSPAGTATGWDKQDKNEKSGYSSPRTYHPIERSSNSVRQDPRDRGPRTPRERQVFENVPVSPLGSFRSSDVSHGPLTPRPLVVEKNAQNAGRKSTASGWWGALSGVIDRPQAAYDPSNIL